MGPGLNDMAHPWHTTHRKRLVCGHVVPLLLDGDTVVGPHCGNDSREEGDHATSGRVRVGVQHYVTVVSAVGGGTQVRQLDAAPGQDVGQLAPAGRHRVLVQGGVDRARLRHLHVGVVAQVQGPIVGGARHSLRERRSVRKLQLLNAHRLHISHGRVGHGVEGQGG